MKKWVVLMLVLFAAVCLSASAEEAQAPRADCSLEDGLLVVRIVPDAEDAGVWEAAAMDEDADHSVVLQSSDTSEGRAVFTFAPAIDGWDDVEIVHTVNAVCDEFYHFLVEVQDGAFSDEAPYMEHVMSPDKTILIPYMAGEWREAETQFHTMEIADGEGAAWNVEIVSPVSHGAYRFTATACYDCTLDALVFTDGIMYDLPADGEEPAAPAREGLAGCLYLEVAAEADGKLLLLWKNPVTEEEVCFARSGENLPDVLVPETLNLDADEDVMPDGLYWADINPEDLKPGRTMDVIYYTVDIYSGVDIGQITPGEFIFRDYKLYCVDSVSEDRTVQYREIATGNTGTLSFVGIPGTDDFVALDVSGSGLPMLTFQNIADTPLADEAVLSLIKGDLEAEAVDAEAMAKAIESDTEFEDCRTVVRIQDNRITEIRHYAEVSVPDMMADVLALNVEK